MWAGQLGGEVLNLVLKHYIKQERPSCAQNSEKCHSKTNRRLDSAANGYGFPSSHSQYMGYFASFLMLHLYFRHRFSTTGSRILDQAWRAVIYLALILWALVVAYSRYVSRAMFHSLCETHLVGRKILPPLSQHRPDPMGFGNRRGARSLVLYSLRAIA